MLYRGIGQTLILCCIKNCHKKTNFLLITFLFFSISATWDIIPNKKPKCSWHCFFLLASVPVNLFKREMNLNFLSLQKTAKSWRRHIIPLTTAAETVQNPQRQRRRSSIESQRWPHFLYLFLLLSWLNTLWKERSLPSSFPCTLRP